MMSAALKWQNTFITVISHYKKCIRKPPHYFFCEALSTTHDNYLIIACNCNTLLTLSLCTKNTTHVHFCSMRNHHKLLQQVIPNKFIFNFIPCTKQAWNLLDADVTEPETQMGCRFSSKQQKRLPRRENKQELDENKTKCC